jgi:hypothetical protein
MVGLALRPGMNDVDVYYWESVKAAASDIRLETIRSLMIILLY